MKLIAWLKKWELDSLKINAHFLELEIKFNDADQKAAWEMYVELLTRVTTQDLAHNSGDEKTALESIATIFPITRNILKQYGSDCIEFTKIAVVILNQIIRPFTAKWHKISLDRGFEDPNVSNLFREELDILQHQLKKYTKLLSDIAGVEDITTLENI